MADVLDELKRIRDAELNAKIIVANANKKAQSILSDAEKEGDKIRAKIAEQRENIEKEMDLNYSRTYSLMSAKLERDYSKRQKNELIVCNETSGDVSRCF